MDSSELITVIFADMTADARVALYGNLHNEVGLHQLSRQGPYSASIQLQVDLCIAWGAENNVEFLILDKIPEHGLPIYGLRTDPLTLLKLL
jgi:hypothetical protein